ncbi:MAG: calcium/sodium antiporter [Candidatus Schekmanbacteria bacterium]|nr:calcium/sodium antiporter [Candidatus Schekmanbacteria bacterium]
MQPALSLMYLVAGLVMLTIGAELLVRGASRLAAAVGVSSLIVGLTVVAFGTSAPELAVSIRAGLAGQPDIAIGNALGSNVFNVLAILGLSALVAPLVVSRQLVLLDVPVLIAVSLFSWMLAADGNVSRADGLVLLSLLAAYTGFLVHSGRQEMANAAAAVENENRSAQEKAEPRRLTMNLVLVVAGLALLVSGADLFVGGAVAIARVLGVTELVIGLTVIAAGTSLPEMATSVVASMRGERDIAVGNIVGSSIFNLLAVMGGAAAVAPAGIAVSDASITFDFPVAIAVAVACLPVFFTGHLISRWEGGTFLAYYFAYLTYLFLAATGNAAAPAMATAMMYFVLPLTVLTLGVIAARAWHAGKALS